jgi:hypothetical protein
MRTAGTIHFTVILRKRSGDRSGSSYGLAAKSGFAFTGTPFGFPLKSPFTFTGIPRIPWPSGENRQKDTAQHMPDK